MKKRWLQFGCFLTGHNYNILIGCSEIAARTVKRYTAAIIIVCILWGFIGYAFTQRYIKGGTIQSILGAILLIVIIVQIERQIILSPKGWLASGTRIVIAIAMSIIGSIILDQILYKDDIALNKIATLSEKANSLLPKKTLELSQQIRQLDSGIFVKEEEKRVLLEELAKNPTIKTTSSQTLIEPVKITGYDSIRKVPFTKTDSKRTSSYISTSILNPKMNLVPPIDQYINILRNQKSQKDSALLTLRPALEKELQSKTGLLDELNALFNIISASGIALLYWIILTLLLLGLELLVLFCKLSENSSDYEETLMHQMQLGKRKLAIMSKQLYND